MHENFSRVTRALWDAKAATTADLVPAMRELQATSTARDTLLQATVESTKAELSVAPVIETLNNNLGLLLHAIRDTRVDMAPIVKELQEVHGSLKLELTTAIITAVGSGFARQHLPVSPR